MIIGRLIRARRKQLKLTQTQLARRVGVTQAAVSSWESEVYAPVGARCISALERALKLKDGTIYRKLRDAAA